MKLPKGTKLTAVSADGFISMGLTSTGSVLAWGDNSVGELGNGTSGTGSDVPVKVKLPAHTKAIKVAGGGILWRGADLNGLGACLRL